MTMIKALIIDDEIKARNVLKHYLESFIPQITEIRQADSVDAATDILTVYQPDIVLLDVEMPHKNGFQFLIEVKDPKFDVIFTTAYNQYAIQAIRFSALDYLLKPINGADLKKAVDRFQAKKELAPGGEEQYRNFIRNITRDYNSPLKLALPGINGIQYVLPEEIIRLQAERNYSRLYFVKGKNFLSSKTLAEYEKILRDAGFIRVHRSHLINPAHIAAYEKHDLIRLNDGCEIEVSRRKKEAVARYFGRGGGGDENGKLKM